MAVNVSGEDRLGVLEELLEFRFSDRELLGRALRHGSARRAAAEGDYQRLEFLGDAVLNHAVARLLFERFPDHDQGMLTRMRAHVTRSVALAERAALLGLEGWVELGPSEETSRGRERTALLEDIFEAIIGAIEVDGGFAAAADFVQRQFGAEVEDLGEERLRLADPKTALQEEAQARGLPLPAYHQVGSSGPDHHRRWAFVVTWDGEELARGEGTSKRAAQQAAARRALARLGLVAPQVSG